MIFHQPEAPADFAGVEAVLLEVFHLSQEAARNQEPIVYVLRQTDLLGQDTAREPMATLMRLARRAEELPGVLSVSPMAGFPYADVPEMGPSVIVVADGDRAKAKAVADELAAAMWNVREQLYVPCPTPAEAVTLAVASKQTPVLLVDLGDNIGGGSAGDGTVLLAELLRQKAKGFVVALYAPEAVRVGLPVEIVYDDVTADVTLPRFRPR